MTITIGRITGPNVRVHGQSQGFLGLPVRHGQTFDTRTKQTYPSMEIAWIIDLDDIGKLLNGEPLILQILGSVPPPMAMWVGDVNHPDNLAKKNDVG